MPSRRLVNITLALRRACQSPKKEDAWQDRTVAQAICWGRAIMPIKAPQTIEDEQPTANRSPCRLDRPRGSQTLTRTITEPEAPSLVWFHSCPHYTGHRLHCDNRITKLITILRAFRAIIPSLHGPTNASINLGYRQRFSWLSSWSSISSIRLRQRIEAKRCPILRPNQTSYDFIQ